MKKGVRFLQFLFAVLLILMIIVVVRSFIMKPDAVIRLAKIPEGEYDPAVWGKHYPLEYKSYQKNFEMSASPTGHGGSLKIQKSITQPEMLVNFKGMAFGEDYTEERGHPYALTDLKETKRITPSSPGACMTCKTANLIDIYKEMGWNYAKTPLADLFPKMKHPIVCGNCHNPATMELRVINPAFIEAMKKKGIDVQKASRQQMRSYVCGQCHVEYYFQPGTSKVTLPWDKGFNPEQMYAYYQEMPNGFLHDWIHPDSKASMLKAQHPEFETWINGTHGKAGVQCADCHMPYVRDSGRKYTSHWVTSPMKTPDASCRPCHEQTTEWLTDQVRSTQGQVWQLQRMTGTVIAKAHERLGEAGVNGRLTQENLDKARELLRRAQWYWDMVSAENSMGFHNPGQVMSTLGQSIDLAYRAMSITGN